MQVEFSSGDVNTGGFAASIPISIVATWSVAPSSFVADDINVISGKIKNFTSTADATVFTFDIYPEPNSNIASFNVEAGTVSDSGGQQNTASETFTAYWVFKTQPKQEELLLNSYEYDDDLNQASAEFQIGAEIASGSVVAATSSSFVIDQDLPTAGANKGDRIVVSGNQTYDGSYEILSLSYNSETSQTTATVDSSSLTPSESIAATSASIVVGSSKSLERDLNHIRSQLKLLVGGDYWYSTPSAIPIAAYKVDTEFEKDALTAIDVGFNYIAGTPYDIIVYLNGQALTPSVVANGEVTEEYDYQECDASGELVEVGAIGRTIKINFGLYAGDILQIIWTK